MIKKILIPLLLTFSLHANAMNFELNSSIGAQISWPIAGQFGVGTALNFPLASLVLFPYLSLDLHGVEYLDKTVYFKEVGYGAGAKIFSGNLIYRGTFGRIYRMYEELADESYRLGLGFGTRIKQFEVTINYHHYYPLEKKSVVLMTGMVF
ncbi:MAG: hypothetical protein KAG61_12620 [Bacteriovoracaceae bacterium]|nr:hypothetical protein [Bacteriovoracaceae bacterium]